MHISNIAEYSGIALLQIFQTGQVILAEFLNFITSYSTSIPQNLKL